MDVGRGASASANASSIASICGCVLSAESSGSEAHWSAAECQRDQRHDPLTVRWHLVQHVAAVVDTDRIDPVRAESGQVKPLRCRNSVMQSGERCTGQSANASAPRTCRLLRKTPDSGIAAWNPARSWHLPNSMKGTSRYERTLILCAAWRFRPGDLLGPAQPFTVDHEGHPRSIQLSRCPPDPCRADADHHPEVSGQSAEIVRKNLEKMDLTYVSLSSANPH